MGKISMQTIGLYRTGRVADGYRLVKEAGFDAVDANVDSLSSWKICAEKGIPEAFRPELSEAECLAYFKPFKDAAEEYGLENYQAHALYPTCLAKEDDAEYDRFLLTCVEKTIRAMDYINCRNLVVHPFFKSFDYQVSKEEEWQKNIDSYAQLIPAAKAYGVKINLENMFIVSHEGEIVEAICGDPDEACRYIDTLNGIAGEKVFGFCLDTGHVNLGKRDLQDVMVKLGDRISCFHVHDNDGKHDQHLVPYWGTTDWDRFSEGLKMIGYRNTLSCEGGNTWGRVPEELRPALLKFTADSLRRMTEKAGY